MKRKYLIPESSIVDLSFGRLLQSADVEIGSGTVETSDFDAKQTDGDNFDDFFENNFDDDFNKLINKLESEKK